MKKTLLAIAIILISTTAYAEIDMSVIATIESSNNPNAYNESENSIGLYGIRLGALRDYNMAHIRGGFSHEEMYNPAFAYKVAYWYFNVAIPRYLKNWNIEDTTDHRIIAYNFGIGNLRKYLAGEKELPQITKNYIKKYHNLKGE